MNRCRSFIGLKFDKDSLEAIKRISLKQQAAMVLHTSVSLGAFSSIFITRPLPKVLHNITQADWENYAKAIKAIPIITKRFINLEIDLMILKYQSENNFKLLQFWECIHHVYNQ